MKPVKNIKFFNSLRPYSKDVNNKIKNKYTSTVLLPKTDFPQQLKGTKLTQQNELVFEVNT